MILKKKEFFLLIFLIFLQSCSGGRIGNFLESSFNDLEKTSLNEDLQNNLLNKNDINLEKENNSKEVTISKTRDKDIPKDLFFSIASHLNKLNISTSNLSKKKYIFDASIDNLLFNEKDLVDKIFIDLQSHLILCEKNSGIWSVEYLNEIFFIF